MPLSNRATAVTRDMKHSCMEEGGGLSFWWQIPYQFDLNPPTNIRNISSIFSSNSEASASELVENIEEKKSFHGPDLQQRTGVFVTRRERDTSKHFRINTIRAGVLNHFKSILGVVQSVKTCLNIDRFRAEPIHHQYHLFWVWWWNYFEQTCRYRLQ